MDHYERRSSRPRKTERGREPIKESDRFQTQTELMHAIRVHSSICIVHVHTTRMNDWTTQVRPQWAELASCGTKATEALNNIA